MNPFEILALVAMLAYAVYRQTRRTEVVGDTRFTLAVIYAVIGLVIGGFHLPDQVAEVWLLVGGVALGLAVGFARGRLTRVEVGGDGRVYSHGTALTISLFLGMVAVKVALGFWAYAVGASDHGGFGEILIMIAIMMALQAEIVWGRARPLGARRSTRSGRARA